MGAARSWFDRLTTNGSGSAARRQSAAGLAAGEDRQLLVHGAGAEALQVERDVGEAQRLDALEDACPERFVGCEPGELIHGDFDARNRVVVADPQLAKPLGAQQRLGSLDLTESFGGHFGSVGDA